MSAFSKPGYELVQLDQDETGNPIYGYVPVADVEIRRHDA